MDEKMKKTMFQVLDYMREVSLALRTKDMDHLIWLENQNVNLRVDIREYVE